MSPDKKGFTLIEIVSVLVILGLLAAIAVPKYYDLQEEARMKAAVAAVAEAQARINLAFAQYVLTGHSCEQLDSVLLRESDGKEDTSGKLFIGDSQNEWGDKVGGWSFWPDSIRTLKTFGETTKIVAVQDPEGRKIDVSGAGLFLHFPEYEGAGDRNAP